MTMLTMLLLALLLMLTGCQNTKQSELVEEAGRGGVPPASSESGQQGGSQGGSAAAQEQGTATDGGGAGYMPTGRVTALRLADADTGWIGGEGWIARTDDRGKQWQRQYEGSGTVAQLFALNAEQAWATLRMNGQVTGGSLKLLHTSDGGKSWRNAGEVPNDGFLHFVTPEEGLSGRAHTTDGGATWSELPVPEGIAGDPYYNTASYGWAVTVRDGNMQIMHTADSGRTWTSSLSRQLETDITATIIRSGGTGDAWVELVGDTGMTQTSYSLLHTADGGQTWRTVLNQSTAGGGPAPGVSAEEKAAGRNEGNAPGALYVVDSQTAYMGGVCMACDEPNSVGWTQDGGQSWSSGSQRLAGYGEQFLGFADASRGWLITNDAQAPSALYVTEDGGRTWTQATKFASASGSS